MISCFVFFPIVLISFPSLFECEELQFNKYTDYRAIEEPNLSDRISLDVTNDTEIAAADPCNPNPCLNNQACTVISGKARCKCKLPYKGDFCEKSPCYPNNPCKNGGECKVYTLTARCSCQPGYKGNKCDSDPCGSKPCSNGGTCSVVGNGFKCNCRIPFRGDRCEKSPCTTNPCKNGGICTVTWNGYRCNCMTPYSGNSCEIDPCTAKPCSNGGICSVVRNGFKCSCRLPFIGDRCEKDPCTINPCKNDGICTVAGNGYKCNCKAPYYGEKCEKDPCSPNPCLNGGICKTVARSFKCECKDHFEGNTCEIKCDCENGHCKIDPPSGKIGCECLPEFGLYSERQCKACECGKKANCTFDFGFWSTTKYCLCPSGEKLKDKKCKDPCANNPCKNGGVCRTNDGINANCTCSNLFTGSFCEKVKTGCEDFGGNENCANIGDFWTCINDEKDRSKFKCDCLPGYKMNGTNCIANITSSTYGTEETLEEFSSTPQLKTQSPSSTQTLLTSTPEASTLKIRRTTKTILSSASPDCDCGKYSLSCKRNGDKECWCLSGYSQYGDTCLKCFCGQHSLLCYFDETQKQVCLCKRGYKLKNGICSVECSADCVHGECVILGHKQGCRCYEGYTGSRCQSPLSKNQGPSLLIIIAIISAAYLVLLVVVCMLRSSSLLCRFRCSHGNTCS